MQMLSGSTVFFGQNPHETRDLWLPRRREQKKQKTLRYDAAGLGGVRCLRHGQSPAGGG